MMHATAHSKKPTPTGRRSTRNGKRSFVAFAAAAVCLLSLSAGAATYYRWVDSGGVVHYTATPPQGIAAEKITTSIRETDGATPEASQAEEQQPAAPTRTASLKNDDICAEARQRLEVLQSGRRLRMPTEDGGFRYLNEEDIQEEIRHTQQVADDSC